MAAMLPHQADEGKMQELELAMSTQLADNANLSRSLEDSLRDMQTLSQENAMLNESLSHAQQAADFLIAFKS